MRNIEPNYRTAMVVLTLLCGAGWAAAQAQESPAAPSTVEPAAVDTAAPPPAAEPAADDMAAEDEGAAAPAAITPPTKPFKDAPAEILRLAANSLLLDVDMADGSFVAVGERGHVVTSKDGKTWKQAEVPTRATLTAVDFVDAKNGWAVGHDAAIIHTTDGGATWQLQYFHPTLERPFLDVLFFDAQHGIAIGAYGLMLETADGGENWTETASDIRADEWHFNGITRLGDGSLLIVGEAGGLAHSTDQGKTWRRLTSPYEGSYFGAIPYGDKGAVIFGLRGNAYVTGNVTAGGWDKLNTNTVQNLLGGTALSNGNYVLVGNNGTILRGYGAQDLNTVADPRGKPLAAAASLPGGDLLVFGDSGTQIIKGAAK